MTLDRAEGGVPGRARGTRATSALAAALLAVACALPPAADSVPDRPDVLFVGNSLTAAHDLPGMVADIAEADGSALHVVAITRSGYSLEDHWRAGAGESVRTAAAGVVVLQQGPSSLPSNADHLAAWAERFAGVIRDAGGRPALLMVWPSRQRWSALDAVRDSYAGAADRVGGILIPAGTVWGGALEREPSLVLTASDGFHPNRLGTFAAALTVYGAVSGAAPGDLPCPPLAGPEDARTLLCSVVREVLSGEDGGP